MSFFSITSKRLSRRPILQQNSAVHIFDRGGTYLPVIGALYLCAILSYLFVWVVDPYNLRPWGVAGKLADHPYIDRVVPLLFSVTAHDGSDVVIVGGSTSMLYTKAMLREAFPDASRPVNLSFLAPRARDFKMALDRLEESHSLKRVLLDLEWPYVKDLHGFGFVRDARLYTEEWFDPVPEFNLEAIRLSGHVLKTGIVDLPSWSRANPLQPDEWYLAQRLTTSPEKMSKIARAADISRSWVTGAAPIPCDAMPYLKTILLPFAKRMAARGTSIDIIFPPHSLALYSDWSINGLYSKIFTEKGGPFANLVSLRRCTVEMTSGIANVHVHGFDTDFAITGNLDRYMDTAHLYDHETYREIMLRIAKGDSVLTMAKWPEYENSLKDAVQRFKP